VISKERLHKDNSLGEFVKGIVFSFNLRTVLLIASEAQPFLGASVGGASVVGSHTIRVAVLILA